MKKIFLSIAFVAYTALALAQFSDFFHNKTLRVDYYRIGSKKSESIKLKSFIAKPGEWAGSTVHLIDPFNYGAHRVMVKDMETKKELYSRTYNSLYHEYIATKKGRKKSMTFEETVLIPYPKKAVEIHIQSRNKDWEFVSIETFQFNPNTTTTETIVSNNEVRKIHYSGDPQKKVDFVIVADGYSINDTAKMRADFETFRKGILKYAPFKTQKENINIWGVAAISEDSGITNPLKKQYLNTAVGSTFNSFEIDRYIMTFEIHTMHTAIQNAPYDHVIVMSNTDTYGGGAIYNFYADVTTGDQTQFVVTHEIGHLFGGLADEYVDPTVSYNDIHDLSKEPLEPNITTLVNFDSKWKHLIEEETPIPTPVKKEFLKKVGAYEGGGYQSKGIYRPAIRCMMNAGGSFCPVCQEALEKMFKIYTE